MKTFELKEYKLVISEAVLEIFSKHKQNLPHLHECGGIVLGQVSKKTIFVNRASTPNIFDRSSRYRFERDKDAAQIIVDYEFQNSSQRITYLGEWHTHPENHPTPSGQDRKMIKAQYKLGKLNESFLLLIIQGLESLHVSYFDGSEVIQCKPLA